MKVKVTDLEFSYIFLFFFGFSVYISIYCISLMSFINMYHDGSHVSYALYSVISTLEHDGQGSILKIFRELLTLIRQLFSLSKSFDEFH